MPELAITFVLHNSGADNNPPEDEKQRDRMIKRMKKAWATVDLKSYKWVKEESEQGTKDYEYKARNRAMTKMERN